MSLAQNIPRGGFAQTTHFPDITRQKAREIMGMVKASSPVTLVLCDQAGYPDDIASKELLTGSFSSMNRVLSINLSVTSPMTRSAPSQRAMGKQRACVARYSFVLPARLCEVFSHTPRIPVY